MSCATESHAYVIFGATGNLAMAKLLPALFQLHCLGRLAPDVRILGCGRTPFTQEAWRREVRGLEDICLRRVEVRDLRRRGL